MTVLSPARRALASLVLCAVIAVPMATAQTAQRSALIGRVTDPSGAPVAGARVTLSGAAALGGARTSDTDDQGRYRFLALLPGAYALSAEADGFQRATQADLRLPVETTWTIDFSLDLRTIAEQVEVEAPTPMVDITSSASLAVIDRALLPSGWSMPLPAEEPFSRITPTLNLLDLRLEKTLLLRGQGRALGLYLDAMNVANVGAARSYLQQSSPNFGQPRSWTDPRTIRLGLRYAC